MSMTKNLIAQRYELGKLLGQGAVGAVYEAVDTATNEAVAVKVLTQKEFVESQHLIERFIMESEALRKLNHPNIVKLIEYLQFEDEHYIVMELVKGGTLTDRIKLHKQMPLDTVLDIALELADALTRAHHLNIIHRDIKPANILLAEDGTPRLTDFGVARIGESEMTKQGQVLGTLPYLSPETFLSQKVSTRSDIWSFGVVVYEMLTGERPFNMQVPAAIITAILTKQIPRIENKRSDAPIALIDLIYRMLEKNPDARVPSMRLVGAELEKIRFKADTDITPPDHQSVFKTMIEPVVDEIQTHVPAINNLPAQSTPFFGRSEQLHRLADWLSTSSQRLLTVVGLGGVGKTRTALAAAQDGEVFFSDGIFFVPLATIESTDQLIPAIGEVLKLQFSGDDDPRVELLEFVREKNALLILDNLEHLPDATDIITEILSVAPRMKILATSRERLRLKSEIVLELPGLKFPDANISWDKMQKFPAVQLFIDSARRVQGDFKLTEDNAPDVATIIKLVDGLPLGIELAAAWLEVLSVKEVKDEVQQSLDFLQSNLRDVPERHRSMRAIFDYSWNLMTVEERDVFLKLSVFRGGFERQAAEEIAGASLSTLSTLVNKSLIRRNPEGRYFAQGLLREYAIELFGVFSDELTHTHDRHATYYSDLLVSGARHFDTQRERDSIATIDRDIDNIRAAWRWAMQQEDWDMLSEMLHPLAMYFHARSMLREGHNNLHALVDILRDNPTQDTLYWKALLRSVWLLLRIGEFDVSYRQASDCLGYFDNTPMTFEVILSLNSMAYARMMQGQLDEAIELSSGALEKAHEIDDASSLYMSLSTLGYAKYLQGDYAGAVSLHEQLLYLHKEGRLSPLNVAASLNNYGEVIAAQGRHNDAVLLFEQALDTFRQYRNRRGMAVSLNNLAGINLSLGEIKQAKDQYERAHRLNKRIGNRYGTGFSLSALGKVASYEGHYDDAIRYHQQALQLRQELGHQQGIADSLLDLGLTYMAQGNLEDAYTYCEQSADIRRQIEDKSGLTMTLIRSAFVAQQRGDFTLARDLLKDAETLISDVATITLRRALRSAIVDFEVSSGNLTPALETAQEIVNAANNSGDEETMLYALAILAHGYHQKNDSSRAATIAQSIVDLNRAGFRPGTIKARQVLEIIEEETPRESVSIEELIKQVG